jgi:hypothetical protein
MKPQLLVNVRRPVPLAPAAKSARVLPARACFARTGAPKRLAVRGCALPGRYARHYSPPTAATDEIVNIPTLIARQSIRRSSLGSYEHEDYIQTLGTGIFLAHRHNRLCAIARNQVDIERIWLTAPKFDRTTNRRMPLDHSPHARVKCTASELAGAAALCCQGSAPASPPPLTAAAFRLVLRLGSGVGKTKAVALFSHTENQTLAMQQTAFAGSASAQLLVLCSCVARVSAPVSSQSNAIGNPLRFPFAFKVWSWPCRVGVRTFVAALCYRASWSCLDALWPPCRAASKYSVFCAVLSALWCSSAGRGRSAAGLSLAPKANRLNAWSATDRWPTNVEME